MGLGANIFRPQNVFKPIGGTVSTGGIVPTVTPATILGSSLLAWFRADLGTWQNSTLTTQAVNNGDPVGGWVDQSGNNYNVLQATSADRPTLELGDINGYPALRFNGSTDSLSSATLTAISQPITVVVVCQPASLTPSHVVDGVNFTNRTLLYESSSGVWAMNGGTTLTGPSFSANEWCILNAVFNGSSSAIHLNGGTDSTGNAGTDTLTGLLIGAGAASGNFYGDVAEVIWGVNVTTSQRSQLDAYCGARYGITI